VENKEYILIDSEKVAKIKYEALQKLARHSGEPLSEASIEARAVLQVVNYLYENNVWVDIHNRNYSFKTEYQEYSQDPGLISTSDNTTEWTTETVDGVTIHQSKPKSIDAVELLYNIVKNEVDELNKDR
jgi:hypothetical protein